MTELGLATLILSLVLGAVGIALGFLAGQSILAQAPGQGSAVGQLPRIRNLGWVFAGSFSIFVADRSKLQLPAELKLYLPWLGYLAGCCVGLAVAFALAWRAVGISVNRFNANRPPERQLDLERLRHEYLLNGKERYEKLRQAQEERIFAEERAVAEAAVAARQAHDSEMGELRRQANELVVANIYAVVKHLRPAPVRDHANAFAQMDVITTTIRAFVRAYAGRKLAGAETKVRVTVMGFVPANAADAALHAARRFTKGVPDDYVGDLELLVPKLIEGDRIVLPVARASALLLPGAPRALQSQNPTVLNIREKRFPEDGPVSVRGEIAQYFRRPDFDGIRSITSIGIHRDGLPAGVLNIETSQDNFIGAGEAEAAAVVDRLQVPIALLAAFL